jgi:hypothetical protein
MNELLKSVGGLDKIIKLIVMFLAALAIYFAIKAAITAYKRRNAGFQVVNGQQLDPNKNYDSYAKAVADACTSWWQGCATEMSTVAQTLLPLNNDELKQVNNRYLSLYGNGTETLKQAMDVTCFLNCSDLEAMQVRLNALGIL